MTRKRVPSTSAQDIAAAAQPAPTSSGDLGPAVTQEFSDALGLHELGSAGRSPRVAGGPAIPSSPAPAPAPVVDYAKLIAKMLTLVDVATSAALGIPPESPSDLETPAECITPWVTAHAGDVTNETGMRLLALSGLITFIAMKVVRWSQKQKEEKVKKPPRPDVAAGGAPEDALAPRPSFASEAFQP